MMKKLLTITTLLGALTIGGVASADHDRDRDRDDNGRTVRSYKTQDVIGTERLERRRGTADFTVDRGMRRDGLQLRTSGGVRILGVTFIYSDGRHVDKSPRDFDEASGGLLTIQTGRPPGLRTVRVHYARAGRSRNATLQLIQLHTGDGYTREQDLWKYNDDEGYYPDEDDDRDVDRNRKVRSRVRSR